MLKHKFSMNLHFYVVYGSSETSPVVRQPSSDVADLPTLCLQHAKQPVAVTPHAHAAGSGTQPVGLREHRRPCRPGIVWAAGSKLEAKDFLNKW